ncbi:HNH restriction endonuclease [Bacillus phage 000TH008]|nr:HNH restriction endonuclease [Bacillus phage 000TH008]QQO40821.1 HNH restriction endonuclease [Bacillus phage 000TH009]
MKQCSKCKKYKDETQFNKGRKRKDGTRPLVSQCKACLAEYKKIHYSKNRDKYLDKAKKQWETHRDELKLYWKEHHQKNKDRRNSQMKEYSQTERGREVRKRAQEKYRKSSQYNLKQNARKKVRRAVNSGKLIKPDRCECCNKEIDLEAHHVDYHKPLEVKWLCKKCHENEHHLNEGHKSI